MKSTPTWVLGGLLAVNAGVAVLFLWLSSQQWIEPELRDNPGARGGGPLVFYVTAIQLLGPMLALNAVWLIYALLSAATAAERARSAVIFGLAGMVWWALFLFSASRL